MEDRITGQDLTAAIADHLALRQRNAGLEDVMPLRDYLPRDYVPVEDPTDNGNVAQVRSWFDPEDTVGLDWAA